MESAALAGGVVGRVGGEDAQDGRKGGRGAGEGCGSRTRCTGGGGGESAVLAQTSPRDGKNGGMAWG